MLIIENKEKYLVMTNYNIELDSNELLLDFETATEADITLTPEQIDRAIALSETIINPQQQWQTYLNAIALFGFVDWLQDRDRNLPIQTENCSVTQPHYANYLDGVFNLLVGDFKVCLLTNGVAINESVTISRAILELPEYAAHYYILINVIEENSEIVIDSFISYQQILAGIRDRNLVADDDWNYEVPLTWFNCETDDLLLYLRCLNSQAISLPTPQNTINPNLPTELATYLTQLQSPTMSLAEILTWEQGKQLLSNPELLTWLYQLQTGNLTLQNAITNLRNRFTATVEAVTQRVINVKSWLSNELDEIAQNLAWNLLPTPAFAVSALRNLQVINRESPIEEFEAILAQLRNSEEDIPVEAGGAYQDFNLGSYALRLFAMTWAENNSEKIAEWNLLIVLGAQINSYLPQDLKLALKLDAEILDEKTVETDTDDTYIYTRVIGELTEQFTVTISLATGESITLPQFAFQ